MGKSKVLRFSLNWEREHLRLKLGSKEIEEVSEFKCLGYFVSADGLGMGKSHGRGGWLVEERIN